MIELTDVRKSYGPVVALAGVTERFEAGRTTVLIGPSGCGKSTLLRTLIGLVAPDAGTVRVADEPVGPATVRELRHRTGYVIQSGGLFPHLTARGNVSLAARHLGWPPRDIETRIHEVCELVRFPAERLDAWPGQLSGGQRQRVSLLRALMLQPELLLLDEPLGALDPMIRADLQDDLRGLFQSLGRTVVMVTHDLAEAAHFAHRIVLMQAGRVVQTGPAAARGDRRVIRPTAGVVLTLLAAWSAAAAGAGDDGPRAGAGGTVAGDGRADPEPVIVGSKDFTEGVILGDIATLAIEATGIPAEHRRELGGTRILWEALLRGDIDVYPEYTGTLLEEIFVEREGLADSDLPDALGELGIGITPPLGFNNTYVLGVTPETAAERDLSTISDLREHPDLTYGFSNEFMDRGDGWPALRRAYGLDPAQVRGLDHDLAYRALAAGSIDVIDLYSTDAEIEYYDLVTLEDDLGHFPEYEAVFLFRLDLADREPAAVGALDALSGKIDGDAMIGMNAAAKLEGAPGRKVAASFLSDMGVEVGVVEVPSRWSRIAGHTADHLVLVLISMALALATALPLGILAARNAVAGRLILGVVGAIYTIPALALLVFMIPLMGIGGAPAVVALWLYSLLPIVRNTHAGLVDIAAPLRESAEALGLSDWTKLRRIELPLAAPSIMAGIKTAVVINIGTATVGALIGAGGLGQPILTGIRLADTGLILEGAVPAALLALGAQALFDGLERRVVPRGLRL